MKVALKIAPLVFFCFFQTALAGSLNNPYRVKDDQFISFFHQRLDDWFAKNIFSFKEKLPSQQKKIWQKFIQSNHESGLSLKNIFIPSFEYKVQIENFMQTNSKKNYTFRFLNFQNNREIHQMITGLVKEKKSKLVSNLKSDSVLGLSWSSDEGVSLLMLVPDLAVAQDMELLKSFSKEVLSGLAILEIPLSAGQQDSILYRYGVDSKLNCPGAKEISQRNQRIKSNTVQVEYCEASDWEPEALGPVSEEVAMSFYKGMNLKISAVGITKGSQQVELIWP